ncbi:hypothetical protein TrVFT333_002132 [Trichoderma virens FT-333]|nr:hypothetical protein TrVFT333_002132 [Trichoderma virens FT-333]
MNPFLGDDPFDSPLLSELSHGASLDEICTFFPLDAPEVAEAPAAEVNFDDDEFAGYKNYKRMIEMISDSIFYGEAGCDNYCCVGDRPRD